MNALYVSSVSGIGGAELCLIELIEHLDGRCCSPFLYVEQAGPLVERLERQGIPVIWGGFPFFRKRDPRPYWRAVLHMRSTIRRRGIGLVHVNCDRAVPISVTAARLARVPCVCYVHDIVRAWYLPRYVRYLNQAQCIVANSRAVAARCADAGMQREKVRLIYAPVTTAAFAGSSPTDRRSTRHELGLQQDATVIGIVGKMMRYKGHEELLQAFAVALTQTPRLQLLIVGDTSMTGQDDYPIHLAALIAELGVADHVVFAGFRSDIPAIMSAIDVLAVPSHTEAFGRSAAEALAAGTPVIASDVDGLPEIVQHNVSGLLVPPGDVEALADAIVSLAQDPERRQSMGRRGPASVARFDISIHVREFMRLYSDLTGAAVCV